MRYLFLILVCLTVLGCSDTKELPKVSCADAVDLQNFRWEMENIKTQLATINSGMHWLSQGYKYQCKEFKNCKCYNDGKCDECKPDKSIFLPSEWEQYKDRFQDCGWVK